jgi:glycosyltransferase involved in cell wall biosynthesis
VLAAWRHLSSDRAAPKLLVIGSGSELPRWNECIHLTGLQGSIKLLGFRRDVPRILRSVDLLVAPTRYEAYGLGVHEAICCGIPAIVSRSAGVAERYPSDLAGDLLLDNPSDVDELVRRLRAWRADVEGWKQRVRPFSDQLRSRSWDDMAAEIVAIAEADDSPRKQPL